MANPTEITNIIELTNITEITNTVISVLDKIDIVDITQQPIDWVSVWGIVATVFGAVATMVSAFLMLLSVSAMRKQNEQSQTHADESAKQMTEQIRISADSVEEMKKQNEQMRQQYEDEKEERLLRYDRESIQKFIDTYLTIPTLYELKKYSNKKLNDFFCNIPDSLILLKIRVSYTKYSYLSAYIQEIISYLETMHEENNKYLFHYSDFLLLSIQDITKYMYIGEEKFNTVWKIDVETMKNGLNEGIEDYIKRNETKTP